MLHFFLIVIAAVLDKNCGSWGFRSRVFGDINIQSLLIARLRQIVYVLDRRAAATRLKHPGTNDTDDAYDRGNQQPLFGLFHFLSSLNHYFCLDFYVAYYTLYDSHLQVLNVNKKLYYFLVKITMCTENILKLILVFYIILLFC